MTDTPPGLGSYRLVRSLTIVVIIVALAALGIADVSMPLPLLPPVFYPALVALAAFTRLRWFVWATAIAAVALTVAGYAGSEAAIAHAELWHILFNRVFAGLAALATAAVADRWMSSQLLNDQQAGLLRQRATQLEGYARDVAEREEEITRQNEELQAQTEELERQSEELRVANEQLSRREKMLERLLELSRNLTAETARLSRGTIMERLCEAITELTQGAAAAILMRHNDHFRIVCHYGFGASGPGLTMIPADSSFANLVLSRLQTGYVENLEQRRDLIIPQPADGEPFRSILATPLIVRGRLAGTVEVFTHQRRTWSSEEIAVLESVAAQASVSLEVAELFEAVQQERQRFETVFRTLPLPVLVAEDPLCDVVRPNPAAAALLGVSTEANVSPLQRDVRRPRAQFLRNGRLLPDQDSPIVRAVLHGDMIHAEELELVLPNRDRRAMVFSAAPILDATGQITGGVMAAVDIAPLKRLQQELETRRREAEEASQRKTHFLAAISHDIRTPVNAINLTAELIRRAAGNPALRDEIPSMVTELQNSAASLGILVHDLLDVARFDTGKIEFQETEFSLGTLLADECRQVLPLAQEKRLRLRCEEQTTPIWIRADRVKLSRVLANLLGNAIKFTSEGGITPGIEIAADGRVLIHVSDTGCGIAEQHLPHIFDEFTQLRNPERDRYKGTGLGLAISRRLVEAMGGSINVQSQLDKGSRFTVALPASCVVMRGDAGAAQRLSMTHRDRQLVGLRVLLVEDHQTTRWATAQILTAEGAAVTEARDGHTGLDLLKSRPFDALLLDMMLPDMDGKVILEHLHQERPATLRKLVVLTGDATRERTATVTELGADALISKPINVDVLIATLKSPPAPSTPA